MIKFLDLQAVNDRYANELTTVMEEVLHSGWYLHGEHIAAFETAYSQYIGTRHCIGVGNGLDALTLIYRAYIELGMLHEGDEVLVPANTFIASILAISANGLRPVLVEPDVSTLQLDVSDAERLLSPRTRSMLLVHLYGRCAYTEQIGQFCHRHGLLLVEDNAQAHGCRCADGRRTGSIGAAAGHSFYPGKNLGALGDGGAVTTNDDQLAEVVRQLANYGSSSKYTYRYKGRNSRLDELQAAILNVKLRHLDADNQCRQQVARYYCQHITTPLVTLPQRLPDNQNVYHLFPILCEQRDALQRYLEKQSIETLIHYPTPPHLQQCYAEMANLSRPLTEMISRQELSLPISPVMSIADAEHIAHTVNTFCPDNTII